VREKRKIRGRHSGANLTAVVISIDRFPENRPKFAVYLLILLGLGTSALWQRGDLYVDRQWVGNLVLSLRLRFVGSSSGAQWLLEHIVENR